MLFPVLQSGLLWYTSPLIEYHEVFLATVLTSSPSHELRIYERILVVCVEGREDNQLPTPLRTFQNKIRADHLTDAG